MTKPVTAPPLTVTLGSAVYTFPAERDVTVGRSPDSDIHLDGPALELVSRTHVLLRFDEGRWFAIDKSRNGIFVDGTRTTSCRFATAPASRSALRADRG